MKMIVGLGNPGLQYAKTRHNVGFRVLDKLAKKLDCQVTKEKHKALLGETRMGQEKVILVKPQTFMNLSGEAVLMLAQWYKILPQEIIVVYDDLDLVTGRLRIRGKGSHGGHNGMKSIIALLKTDAFPRLRVGIGSPNFAVADYVLGSFTKEEEAIMDHAEEKAVQALLGIVENGLDKAMNLFNE